MTRLGWRLPVMGAALARFLTWKLTCSVSGGFLGFSVSRGVFLAVKDQPPNQQVMTGSCCVASSALGLWGERGCLLNVDDVEFSWGMGV